MFNISYTLTEQEDLIATMGYYRATKNKRVIYIFLLLSTPIAVYFLYSFFSAESKNFMALIPTVSLFIVPYSTYRLKKDIVKKHKLNFTKRQDANRVIHVELGNERIVSKIDGFKSTDLNWSDLEKSVIIKEGIFLHLTASSYYWLPASGFGSEKEREDAYNLVKSKVENVKDLR